ncbi:uncharacterized protein LOC132757341 [Ruditapes philippinarum]|uniref:uncharacterized protein LOC132757341 n=1 Tax=Ruditapes philippinarum TaxID=129788 RepID=UPI00295BA20B|nr:uncharacterized protein LOC132757341 [Ruditapes philippinarum]
MYDLCRFLLFTEVKMTNATSPSLLFLVIFSLSHTQGTKSSNFTIPAQGGVLNSDVSKQVHNDNSTAIVRLPPHVTNACKVVVKNPSAKIFQQVLKKHNPHFVQFHIQLQSKTHLYKVNKTADVFQPGRWYWTLGLDSKPYQFLSWDIRYGILSFGLLDFKTALVPKIFMQVYGECNLTLGTEETSSIITNALIPLITIEHTFNEAVQNEENFFCYLTFDNNMRDKIVYLASVYFLYPITYFNYNCCFLKYNFTSETFNDNCSKEKGHKYWTHVISFNIILGILIIGFCPIPLFKLFAWLSQSDGIKVVPGSDDENDQKEWVYANGEHPLSFFDIMSFEGIGIDKKWPVLVSRIRRFFCLILAPLVIYIELYMNTDGIGVWTKGDKITVKDAVDVGTPVGFMALLGDPSNRHKVFVPALGGAVGITALYFVLGFFYLVLPKSLKSVVNNGLPNSNALYESFGINSDTEGQRFRCIVIKSPLLFGARDIIKMSKINVGAGLLECGYTKGGTLMRCNFYMLFTSQFWRLVWHIQISRICFIRDRMPMILCLLGVICIPIYIAICLLEMLMCILYFGVPFFFFLVIMIRAAMRIIPDLREKHTMFSYLFSFSFHKMPL